MKHISAYIYIVLFAAVLSAGCTDELDVSHEKSMEIVLKSRIPTAVLSVKSEGLDYDSQITGGLDLSMWRWDEGNSSVNLMDYDAIDANLGGTPDPDDGWTRKIHFDPAQYYRNRTDAVGFIGCYPRVDDSRWVKEGGSVMTEDAQGRPMLTYNIDGQTDVMFSDFKKGSFDKGMEHLTFSHALCRYRIYVYAIDADVRQQWGDLRKVTLMNLPEQLFVHLPEDMTDSAQKIAYTYSPAPSDESLYTPTHLAADIPLPVGISDKYHVGTYLGGAPAIGVLGVNVETDCYNPEATPVSAISIARNFRPGYTYNIILRFSSHGVINADVVTEEWKNGGDHSVQAQSRYFLDISRYGTANTYVVSSANMGYCFNAMVKGNGVNTLERYDGTVFTLPDTDVTLQTDSVAILSSDSKLIWNELQQDYLPPVDDHQRHEPIIRLQDDHVVDGKVLFDVIGIRNPDGSGVEEDYRLLRKGNVRIGGFDRNGDLVWSWHIWVTDRPRNLNYGNGYVSMDRNLGAVSTDYHDYDAEIPVLSGCVYQWGRKDPFFLHEIMNHPEYIKHAPVPVSDAHKYPRSFFMRTEDEYVNGGYDWTTESNPHFWGWISERDNLVKTLYDPCPPGYRVNGNALWEFSGPDTEAPVEVELDGLNVGYSFGIKDYVSIYYPATMFIHHDGTIVRNVDPHQPDNHKAYVYRYSATPYIPEDGVDRGLSYHFRYNILDSQNGADYLINEYDSGGGRVQGFPVRCVYEDSRHEITNLSREQTANCYVVDHARYFRFDARTPGNSVGALNVQFLDGGIRNITFDGGVPDRLSVEKVDVLWWQGDLSSGSGYSEFASRTGLTQEEMEAACPVKVLDGGMLDSEGYVTFRVPSDMLQSANVIMAGYDANGVIQWTWHLWMVPEGLDVVRLGDYTVLDRNLGATFAPSSLGEIDRDNVLATHGFYYQWGRKDPFVGMRSYNQGDNASTSSTWFYKSYDGVWTRKTSLDRLGRAATNIIETIKNPTYFCNSGASRWQNLYESDSSNDGPVNQMWGYTGVSGAWGDTFAKTMWDPCPPGYKVAHHIVFNSGGLWNPNTGSVESYRLYYNGAARSDYGLWLTGDKANGGMYTSNNANSSSKLFEVHAEGLWLPNTRRISESGVYRYYSNTYETGHMHSACPYSGSRTRTYRWVDSNNSYMTTSHANDTYLSSGTALRCLKE